MFSYYGRKTKVVKYYPKPTHDIIIEPFAGTAVYSLYEDNWKRDVRLYDKYETIVDVWRYLQNANPQDILSLPNVKDKEDISIHTQLSDAERSLMYFCSNRGSAKAYKIAGAFNNWDRNKQEIADSLYKIKHWKIELGDYRDIENIEATWFIDQPYEFGGHRYEHSNKLLDFASLSKWCKERNGQVIVCENTKADWLPFAPLKEMRGIKHTATEAIWTN